MTSISAANIKKEKLSPAKSVKKEKDTSTAAKSSTEILSELFGVFNAEPPKISEEVVEDRVKKSKKSKDKKKKHKKEKKKRRYRRYSESSDDSSGSSPHRKSKKRKKTKIENIVEHKDTVESDATPPRSLTPELTPDLTPELTPERRSAERKEPASTTENKSDVDSIPIPKEPDLSQICLPEDVDPKSKNGTGAEAADKSKGRIQIKSLKFSAIFEEAVKHAEEEARKKKEKYEDGELSHSSSDSESDAEDENTDFPKSSNPGGISSSKTTETPAENDIKSTTITKSSKDDKINGHSKSSKSRRRSSSRSRRRARKRSSSRTHSRRTGRKSRHHSRSRHRSRSHRRSRSRHRSKTRRHSRSPHRSSTKSRRRRRRSRSGSRGLAIDKKRLLEIARRNALLMLRSGAGAPGLSAAAAALGPHAQQKVISAIKAGGKSVDELTDFCKNLSKKEAMGELSSLSSNNSALGSDNEDTRAFHHPFLVKEKAPIVMNIRGGVALPTKKEELRIQFPVSSGNDHRGLEWRPVSPKNDAPKTVTKPAKSKGPLALPPAESTQATMPPAAPLAITMSQVPIMSSTTPMMSNLSLVPMTPTTAPGPQAYPPGMQKPPEIDIGSLVAERLSALRRQTEPPAIMGQPQTSWQGTNKLGQFTGTTGANILTPRELASGSQAWAKKDQLVRAAPVAGGLGMALLQKMGWEPGKGLGKEGTGALTPLLLEVKLDTRGLVAKEEMKPQRHVRRNHIAMPSAHQPRSSCPTTHIGKHPVSLLGEYCSKRKLGAPCYTLCFECGPDHKKNFLFKVRIDGVEYQPSVASINKKQAKADAAQVALQKLGIIP